MRNDDRGAIRGHDYYFNKVRCRGMDRNGSGQSKRKDVDHQNRGLAGGLDGVLRLDLLVAFWWIEVTMKKLLRTMS